MSMAQAVARNVSIQMIGRVLSLGIGLAMTAALTRLLGVAGFGYYTAIFSFVNLLAVIADFGFFNVLIQELSVEKRSQSATVSNIMTFRSIFAGLVFGVGTGIAFFLSYTPEVKVGIGVVSIALFLMALSMTLIGVFQVKMKMEQSVLADLVGKVANASLLVYLLLNDFSLPIALLSYVVGNLITLGINFYLVSRYVQVRPAFDRSYLKEIIPRAGSMGIFVVLSFIYFHVDMNILSLMKGEYDVGIYGAAYKLVENVLVFAGILSGALLSPLTVAAQEGTERFSRVVNRSLDGLLILSMPLIILVLMLSDNIIGFIAGSQFTDAAVPGLEIAGYPATAGFVLRILIIGVGFSYLSHVLNTSIIALGKQRKLIGPLTGITVLNIVLNLWLIPRYSYLAAASLTVLCELLILFYPLRILGKEKVTFKLPPSFLVVAFASLAMVMMAYLLSSLHVVILSILCLGVYGLILYVSGISRTILMKEA